MPTLACKYLTKPEQSKPAGVKPPHRYGTPRYVSAMRTSARGTDSVVFACLTATSTPGRATDGAVETGCGEEGHCAVRRPSSPLTNGLGQLINELEQLSNELEQPQAPSVSPRITTLPARCERQRRWAASVAGSPVGRAAGGGPAASPECIAVARSIF